MTAPSAPVLDAEALAKWAWASHERHCERCQNGLRCFRADDLIRAANVESGRRWGWETAQTTTSEVAQRGQGVAATQDQRRAGLGTIAVPAESSSFHGRESGICQTLRDQPPLAAAPAQTETAPASTSAV